tara:strand:- start:29 stop:265 length:237 start_codon:yes stop_codon:yes gene_type:complete
MIKCEYVIWGSVYNQPEEILYTRCVNQDQVDLLVTRFNLMKMISNVRVQIIDFDAEAYKWNSKAMIQYELAVEGKVDE